MSFDDGVAFADVVNLVGGDNFGCILNVTEQLTKWAKSYCILDYFSLIFFLSEWLAFLYYLSSWLELASS